MSEAFITAFLINQIGSPKLIEIDQNRFFFLALPTVFQIEIVAE